MHAKATEAFSTYKRQLHRYLMRRLRTPHDVDDLAMDVYEKLLAIPDEKIVEKPLAYVYGIASHVLADHRLDKQAEDRVLIHDDPADWADTPSCVLPDDLAERLNLQQQINWAMAQLPATHAAVLLAHKRDGLSYEECAEKLGLSIFTIEKYVAQSKARIRSMAWDR